MEITIHIPEDLARSLGQESGDLSRRTLEALAIDGYRSGELTEEQVRRILGYGTRMQVHEFLKEHDVYLNYGLQDLEQDLQTLRQVHEKESARAG
jgi:predicted HTH domain antitoxin